MNPQSNQAPGLRLPQPSFDLGQAPMTQPAEAFHAPEVTGAPVSVEAAPTQPGVMPMATSPAMPVAPVQQAQPQQQPIPQLMPSPAQDATAVAQSEDESAVDQEWIAKAREIVEKTHADPYLLSSELSKIKAQYIKVRYNKDIKIVED